MRKDNKTIGITLRFWTNDVNVEVDGQRVKACWEHGVAVIEANKQKNIPGSTVQFHSHEDILPAIRELFRKNKIYVVSSNKRPRILGHK